MSSVARGTSHRVAGHDLYVYTSIPVRSYCTCVYCVPGVHVLYSTVYVEGILYTCIQLLHMYMYTYYQQLQLLTRYIHVCTGTQNTHWH